MPKANYMQLLQESSRENGIDVPLSHNSPNMVRSVYGSVGTRVGLIMTVIVWLLVVQGLFKRDWKRRCRRS